MKTAIIGGIGAGKSHICRMLAAQGIEIYDCDAEARRIMTHDAEVQAELKAFIPVNRLMRVGELTLQAYAEVIIRPWLAKRSMLGVW